MSGDNHLAPGGELAVHHEGWLDDLAEHTTTTTYSSLWMRAQDPITAGPSRQPHAKCG